MISVFHDLLYQPAIYPLLLIARATERVRIGPAALNPSTLHPVELAGQAAALDLASGGRAYLGLVAGAWLERLGLDERRPVQRMREAVEIVRRLHAADRSGFAGDLFTLAPGAGLEYEPARRRVPLMIGTWRPRMAALAGEVADEVKIGGCANPEMVKLMREWIGNDEVGIVIGAVTVVDEDGDAARARAAAEVGMYLEIVGGPRSDTRPRAAAAREVRARRDPGRGRRAGANPARRGREARRVRNTAGTLDRRRRRASV